MNEIKNIRIKDIMISDLLYFDSDHFDTCSQFCRLMNISSMPSLDGEFLYSLVNDTFKKKHLSDVPSFETDEKIFSDKVLEKFEKSEHDVVFVVGAEAKIVGVIHVSDYNNELLHIHFFKYVLQYEKMLRTLLISKGYSNLDLINFLKNINNEKLNESFKRFSNVKGEISGRKLKDMKQFPPFEELFLNDLLYFSLNQDLGFIISEDEIRHIRDIRNWVDHSKSAISIAKEIQGIKLFKLSDLKKFVNKVETFTNSYYKLEMLLIKMANYQKIKNQIETIENQIKNEK